MSGCSLDQLIDRFPFPVIAVNQSQAIEHLNSRAARVLSIAPSAVRGKSLSSIFDGVLGNDELSAIDPELAIAGLSCVTLRPHGDEPNPDWMLIIASRSSNDIEQSKLIETDRMLTRGEMAGEIAHEMNNHLTVLFGNVEILPLYCSRSDCDTVHRKLSLMRSTLEKIAAMSDCLADYGRPQNPRPTSEINNMISKTIDFMTPQNRFDRISVEVSLCPKMAPAVVDLGRLQQAFSNILHNAADELHLANTVKPKILVTSRVCEDDDSIEIEVEDNGRGIPEDILARLMKERISTKPMGEGLGLLACGKIMRDQGGAVLIDSQPGKGAKVTLTVPIASVADAPAATASEDSFSSRTEPVRR